MHKYVNSEIGMYKEIPILITLCRTIQTVTIPINLEHWESL